MIRWVYQTPQEIAKELKISERMVYKHREYAYKKNWTDDDFKKPEILQEIRVKH